MNKKNLYTVLLIVLIASLSQAQEKTDSINNRLVKIPIFSMGYFNYGNSDFNTNAGKGKINMNEWSVAFQYILPLKEKEWYLSNRLHYTYFTFDTELEATNFKTTQDFHSIAYTVGLIKILPKRWKLIVNLSPTIASDFKESLNSDDIIIQASALATKKSTRYFEYGFGLAYSTWFGNATLIPLITLTYKKNNWKTLMVLPAYISQNYLFNENTQLGIKLAVYGNLYNTVISNNQSTLDLNRVAYSRITIGPDFQTKLFGDFYLNVGTGIATRNILEFQNKDLDTELDFNVNNKFFFNLGIKLLK